LPSQLSTYCYPLSGNTSHSFEADKEVSFILKRDYIPMKDHCIPASTTTASRDELNSEQTKLRIISGELPEDLYGHVFMAAALPYGDGTPILNGDGMIYRFDFNGTEVRLKTRIAKTPCYRADEAITKNNKYKKYVFRNAGFTRLGRLGSRNQVNTAFLTLNDGRMLVTFDAGRPYEIDPETLEVLTPVGANSEWIEAVPQVLARGPFPTFFSVAHPFFDAQIGEMFTVNYSNLNSHLQPRTDSKSALLNWGRALLNCARRQLIKGFEDFVDLIRWDGEGQLERWRLQLPHGSPVVIEQSLHQIGVTQDYVVLMDAGFRIEPEQILLLFLINAIDSRIGVPDFIEKFIFSRFLPSCQQLPYTTLYIVRRADLKQGGGTVKEPRILTARKVVIEREAAHFTLDYNNPFGHITLHLAHNCAWDTTEWLHKGSKPAFPKEVPIIRRDLYGMLAGTMDVNFLGRYVIDGESGKILESKTLSDPQCTWSLALYTHCNNTSSGQVESIYWISWGFSKELITERIYESYKDYPHRTIPLKELHNTETQPATLLRLDAVSMEIKDKYPFPAGRFVSSPQFVPRRNSKGDSTDGYITCVVLSDDKSMPEASGDEVWIFDAAKLKEGPLCRLDFPAFSFGLTLHTTWLPKIKQRPSSYHILVREDYAELVAKQPRKVQELFEQEVYPHFLVNHLHV
jgi:hypothetical protein